MRSKDKSGKFDLLWVSSWGLLLVVSTALGLVIGIYLDAHLLTGPVFTIIFLILGMIAGFWQIVKEIIKFNADSEKK